VVVLEMALSFSKLVLDAVAACLWRVHRFEAGAVVLKAGVAVLDAVVVCLRRVHQFEAGVVVFEAAAVFSKSGPSI
jgi:hypothetical protein